MQNITVIGAGIMGGGIAYTSALNNFRVVLHDISEDRLEKSKSEIERLANNSEKRGFITIEQKHHLLENIRFEISLEKAVAQAQLVIEAIIEKMNLKIELFKKLDSLCSDETILATNTSSLSPTEIGSQTSRPEKVAAMHFFNPVHKMKLVEIIRGLETSDETIEIIKTVSEQLGKESVEVNEFPGFVTSRMNVLIGNEAMNMLMEGVASAEDIDKAIKLGLNHPMGPLEMGDLVGLDTRLSTLEYLHKTLGEKYRPSPLLVKYVKAGRLGRKSGRGIYDYQGE
ncbi:3-hydroxyacyl-CoA dehydrogenase [Lysinibacillus yapensis]|uniref:3-hydroxyacyl-CoA dehydrogenase n=1 Tax=Ureibacillus yapensis TaxID=2304605 RepID=A0A396SBJ7_9BACL|nr:3-hydroxyacyl-CoA dehydrogenase [Lysinibacillus yapensis]RHW38741.1 3-hydroxyacyl-CoA dehydrogenase [Lysinibacillus yapensis]